MKSLFLILFFSVSSHAQQLSRSKSLEVSCPKGLKSITQELQADDQAAADFIKKLFSAYMPHKKFEILSIQKVSPFSYDVEFNYFKSQSDEITITSKVYFEGSSIKVKNQYSFLVRSYIELNKHKFSGTFLLDEMVIEILDEKTLFTLKGLVPLYDDELLEEIEYFSESFFSIFGI